MAVSFKTYRTADIDAKLKAMHIRPLDVMLTGVTGAGKSTTCNAFFQKAVAKVGNGADPETMDLDVYELNDFFRVWDTPGLGDGIANDQKHRKRIIDLLYKNYKFDDKVYGFVDMAIVVIDGSTRDMGTTYTLLNEVLVPNIQRGRLLVIINQADMAMSGRHWDRAHNQPDDVLLDFLDRQAISIRKRVKEATGVNILKPVPYSAEYGWNVQKVFDFIIDNMPARRRQLMK